MSPDLFLGARQKKVYFNTFMSIPNFFSHFSSENANGDRGTGDGSDYLQSKNMIIEREDDNSFGEFLIF